jgi:hypothetical protein
LVSGFGDSILIGMFVRAKRKTKKSWSAGGERVGGGTGNKGEDKVLKYRRELNMEVMSIKDEQLTSGYFKTQVPAAQIGP